MSRALCYRCEHRALYLETGHGPRAECKEIDKAISSCYMYSPVKPVRLKTEDGDDRPAVGPSFIRARSYRAGLLDGILCIQTYPDTSFVLYWEPVENTEEDDE